MRLAMVNFVMASMVVLAGCHNAQPYQEYEETENAFGGKTYRWSSGYRGNFKSSGPLDGYTPPDRSQQVAE